MNNPSQPHAPVTFDFPEPPPEPFDDFEPPPDDGYGVGEHLPCPGDIPEVPPLEDLAPAPLEFELDPQLNEGQRRAATLLEGSVMAIAGPGAGKTNTLVQRIGNLLAHGAAPWQIVAWTFTNKAGREIAERVGSAVGESHVRGMFGGTFHSWCLRFVKRELDAVGLRRDFEIVSDSDRKKIIKAAEKEIGAKLESAPSDISFAKGQAPTLEGCYRYVSANPQLWEDPATLLEVWKRYEKVKSERNLVDFDDLILLAATALQDDEVRARWGHSVRHLLVDEYQDCNPAQHALVALLVPTTESTFVVGDTDQSVYAFRGACPSIMDDFRRDFPDTEVVVLEQNYRSTGKILSTVREIISRNPATLRSPLATTRHEGAEVTVRTFNDDRDEARTIAYAIKASIAAGGRAKDWAILTRVRMSIRPLEAAMLQHRIPYTIAGGPRILERKAAKDSLAWLRIAAAPGSRLAFERAAAMVPGLGPKAVADVANSAADGDLVAAARDRVTLARAAGKGGQKGVQAWVKFLEHVEHVGVQETLADKVEVSCHIASTLSPDDGKDEPIGDALGSLARTFVPDPDAFDGDMEGGDSAAIQFLDELALAADALDHSDDVVTLSTVHAAKGKEWPHVWVVAMENGTMPAIMGEDEEERRIAFVALSRAQNDLTLSWARQRLTFQGVTNRSPSIYLRELEAGGLASFDVPLPGKPRAARPARGMW